MDAAEAIQILDKNQIKAYPLGEQFRLWKGEHHFGDYSAREMITFARAFRKNTSINEGIKKLDKRKNRAAVRDLIKTEKFDAIPPKDKVKKEDSWDHYW